MTGAAVTAMINSFLDHLVVERGLSDNTIQAYRRDLHRYAEFLDDHGLSEPDRVDAATITAYAVSLREGIPEPVEEAGPPAWRRPPLAEASAARALVAVRSLHRFAAEEGLSADNPAVTVRPPKAARRLPKALGVAEVQRLLESPSPKTPEGLRDRALLELLYSTGGRISEITGLDVDEVSRLLDRGAEVDALRVLGKGSKERIVPLGRYAKRAVTDYLVRSRPELARRGSGSAALLLNARGARLSRQSAWGLLQTHAERAGISVDVSPHTLRHSFATHLLDGGADVRVVQELLGHASVTTTQIYTLVTVDHLRETYLSAHPRAR